MENKTKKGRIQGLIPLMAFLVLYLGTGIISGNFENMPLMIGILAASGVALFLNNPGEKLSLDEKLTIYCKGAGEPNIMLMIIIFLLAGAFYGVAGSMHAVDSAVNIGLSILPRNMLLPGLFLIGCLLSFSMGTSMGTVSALMPIGIDIATKTGIGLPLICGVVVGGAMFGDNLSFISDTTIAATRTQGVAMKDKFKANFLMVLPAVVLNCILLFLHPIQPMALGTTFEYNIVNIIPYAVIIGLSLVGLNVISVMALGIASGVVIGVMHGDFTALESMKVLHSGMSGMEDMALIAALVGGMTALMHHLGGIDYILEKLTSKTKNARGGELSIAALVSLLDIATTNNTVSIITAGPIARDIADKFGINRKRVASVLDIFSSAFNGLLPYAGQLLVAGGLAGISPASIMPYNWYSIMMLVFGTLFILIGWPNIKDKEAK